jgi:hypothetical protein
MAEQDFLERLMQTIQTLSGAKDPRGPQGILSRGKNVYDATTHAAQSGGGMQYGRYPYANAQAIQRRLFG